MCNCKDFSTKITEYVAIKGKKRYFRIFAHTNRISIRITALNTYDYFFANETTHKNEEKIVIKESYFKDYEGIDLYCLHNSIF